MLKPDIYAQRTSLQTMLIAVLIGVLGVALIILAANLDWFVARKSWQTPTRELGGLLFATVTVALLWELYAKRAFLAELMERVKISEDVKDARLLSITQEFIGGITWDRFFSQSSSLTIFFSYGNQWLDYVELHRLANHHNTEVQLMLPDPNDESVVNELARRFGISKRVVKREIKTTESRFKELFSSNGNGTQISIWYLSFAPVFSYYIFDDVVVLSLYKHRKGPVKIPAFVFEKGGELYNFIRDENAAIISDKTLARRILPLNVDVIVPNGSHARV
jgi:hypothetical protein